MNAGGCQLIDADVKFEFAHNSYELATFLFSDIEGDFKEEELKELIVALEKVNEKAPYRTKNVPNRTSGSKILSRLIAISNYRKQLEEKEWSKEEILIIRQLFMT